MDVKRATEVAVVILTYNEESNIAQALDSVCGWAHQIFIVDSYSTDHTVPIAGSYPCEVFQNEFENYSKQRNFALTQLPIKTEWVLFLDADEWLPDTLKTEISKITEARPVENGFYIKFRLIWDGKWIKRGYYPSWILRLFRYGKARCEDRPVNEQLIIEGETGYLHNDFMHEDRKGIGDWIDKHNRYAEREAMELIKRANGVDQQEVEARLFGTQAQRKRWLRYHVWNRLPPLVRPSFYFFYRYVLTGAFLEGRAAFLYHFMHALWFPMLIDAKYLRMKRQTLQ